MASVATHEHDTRAIPRQYCGWRARRTPLEEDQCGLGGGAAGIDLGPLLWGQRVERATSYAWIVEQLREAVFRRPGESLQVRGMVGRCDVGDIAGLLMLCLAVRPTGSAAGAAVVSTVSEGSDEGEAVDRLMHAGLKVRVLSETVPSLCILGERIAVVSTCERPATSAYVLVRDADLVSIVNALFLVCHARATPTPRAAADIERQSGDQAKAVLGMLSAGCTDDVASRRLGISVRTYRRHVAALMDRLHVRTRFQLGVEAERLGLLTESLCPAARSGVTPT